MLKIINISKYFDQVKAVNNVTINVENSLSFSSSTPPRKR